MRHPHPETRSPRSDNDPNTLLVWQSCTAGSDFSCRFVDCTFEGYLPFALLGSECIDLREGRAVPLDERSLLLGLLISKSTTPDPLFPFGIDDDIQDDLIERLKTGFRFPSTESMVLACAEVIVRVGDCERAIYILESGLSLAPGSDLIKTNLAIQLWQAAAEGVVTDHTRVYQQTLDLVSDIDLDALDAEPRELLCFYAYCALILLERYEELRTLRVRFMLSHIGKDVLYERIRRLLDHPDTCSLRDLCVLKSDLI